MKKKDRGFLSERSCIKQAGNEGWGRPGGQGGGTEAGKSTLGGKPSKCKGPGVRVSILREDQYGEGQEGQAGLPTY